MSGKNPHQELRALSSSLSSLISRVILGQPLYSQSLIELTCKLGVMVSRDLT